MRYLLFLALMCSCNSPDYSKKAIQVYSECLVRQLHNKQELKDMIQESARVFHEGKILPEDIKMLERLDAEAIEMCRKEAEIWVE